MRLKCLTIPTEESPLQILEIDKDAVCGNSELLFDQAANFLGQLRAALRRQAETFYQFSARSSKYP